MAVATQVYDMPFVRSARPFAGGVCLALDDGRDVRLAADHPDLGRWLAEVQSPFRKHYPVALVEEGGWAVALSGALDSPVAWLRDYPGGAVVAFDCYFQICALARDHPEFDRVHATLSAAAGTRQMLWVATLPGETVQIGPDENGEVFDLRQILDARPAPPPA